MRALLLEGAAGRAYAAGEKGAAMLMKSRMPRASPRYETSLDRAGLALGAGSAVVGALLCALLAMADGRGPIGLAVGWLIGSLCAGLFLTAVAGPLWIALHLAGRRRARHAAMVGAGTAFALFVSAQTYGFGLIAAPILDSATWQARWLSAVATSALIAVVAAAVGVLMWRIAYRRDY